ncbi:MAG: hypothetical protein LW834_11805 [Cyanobium sp. 49614_E6]|jgi:hypothetical protein|nr:hypothetical protein [Cyanobium sp. 49614_E6]
MTNSGSQYERFKLGKDLKLARVRIGWMALFHFFLPPIASLVYAIKTEYWTPFILATVVGLFTTLTSMIIEAAADSPASYLIGFIIYLILVFIPAGISFFMYQSRAMKIRARNNIIMPEQADRMLAEIVGMN